MALSEFHYFSEALGKQTAANIILPQGKGKGPFPVLYLLHGLSDDHTMWSRRTNVERYVADLPLIVVMPDGGRGFYCDAPEGFAYETAIARDLIGYIDTVFQTQATRAGRCISGLSMGGYGAVKLALRFPELFVSAHSHSGAVDFAHGFWRDSPEFRRIVGPEAVGGPHDLYRLAENAAAQGATFPWPALRLDCGADDFLIEDNRSFHTHLDQLAIPHEYQEHPGAHTWDYWDRHIVEAIAFHARHLGLKS